MDNIDRFYFFVFLPTKIGLMLMLFGMGLIGCGKSGGGSAGGKALHSTWTYKANPVAKADLTAASKATFTTFSMDVCICDAALNGTEAAGTFNFVNCKYPNGTVAVQCNSLNQSGQYVKSPAALMLCDATGQNCSEYF